MAFEAGFFEIYSIYWTCENGHKFAGGQVRNPGKCPVCQTRLIKEVINRK